MTQATLNLGYWKRSIGQLFTLRDVNGIQYQGTLTDVKRSRWLIFAIPLPLREEWTLRIDRHHSPFTLERV